MSDRRPDHCIIKSSAEFLASYVPPDYVIDGVIQRQRLYTLTGKTNAGKTAVELAMAHSVATGIALGGHEVERGRVLFLAGENPDDVKGRWLAMAQHMNFDPDKIGVNFIEGRFPLSERLDSLIAQSRDRPPHSLVLVDTDIAFFEGDDPNNNKEQLDHALRLRRLTEMHGRPAVVVGSHPVKNASDGNLVPYGGGSKLNEIDGNLTCINTDMVAEVHWLQKFRGPDFEPMHFELRVVTATKLRDSKGRSIPTVIAKALTDANLDKIETDARKLKRRDQDALLALMATRPGGSMASMAQALGWLSRTGKPQKSRVERTLHKLKDVSLVYQDRAGEWTLTKNGRTEAKAA